MKRRSFTLIELLIVLVIIGVVAVLAVPQYQKWVITARGVEAMTNLSALSDSLWRYYIEAGMFPPMEPIYGATPSILDIKIPPSKYFIYEYFYNDQNSISFQAVDYDAWQNGPEGCIVMYSGGYLRCPPGEIRESYIKVHEDWYKWYAHVIKIGSAYRIDDGWPGGGK